MPRKIDPSTGRFHASGAGRPAPVTPIGPEPAIMRPLPARQSWMQELLFEAGLTRGDVPVQGEVGLPAWSAPGSLPSREALLAATNEPGKVIASVEEYRALLHARFDAARDQAIERLHAEPVMVAARRVWQPGDVEGNRRVAESLVRYVGQALGDAYGFEPVPVIFDDQRSAGYRGLYDRRFDRIYLPGRAAKGALHGFLDVVTHEQIHAFQDRLMGRMWLLKGEPLAAVDRMLATYWRNEEGRYRALMAGGSDMSPETRLKYQNLGQEYHAIHTGLAIASALDPDAR